MFREGGGLGGICISPKQRERWKGQGCGPGMIFSDPDPDPNFKDVLAPTPDPDPISDPSWEDCNLKLFRKIILQFTIFFIYRRPTLYPLEIAVDFLKSL